MNGQAWTALIFAAVAAALFKWLEVNFNFVTALMIVGFPASFLMGALAMLAIVNLVSPDRMAERERAKMATVERKQLAEREKSLGKQEAAVTGAVARGATRLALQQTRHMTAHRPSPAKMVAQSSRLAELSGQGFEYSESDL